MNGNFESETQNLLEEHYKNLMHRLEQSQEDLFRVSLQQAAEVFYAPEKPRIKKKTYSLVCLPLTLLKIPFVLGSSILQYAGRRRKSETNAKPENPDLIDMVLVDGVYRLPTENENQNQFISKGD